jgi:glycosyltransferase involved in cell wall biosynthesis
MSGKIKVLALVPSFYDTSPGQRFRIEQWEPLLRERGVEITYCAFEDEALRSVIYKGGNVGGKIAEVSRAFGRRISTLLKVKDFDLVYLFREAALLGPAVFERWIGISKIPYIFDFDDAVFVGYKSPANGYLSYLKFPGKTRTICKGAAHVMAGNQYLADYALAVNPNVTIIPTTIDTEIYLPDYSTQENPRTISLLWSGSFSTVQHLDTIRGALQKLAKEAKFKLRVIGTPEFDLEGVETEAIQWRAATEIEDLRAGHIGLMPLPDEAWSKGKCGLKALQYMALGIPTICSPVGVNSTIIRDGENGFLASTEDEWVTKLKFLIDSAETRLRIGREGRKTVEDEYSAKLHAPRVYDIFASVASRPLIR